MESLLHGKTNAIDRLKEVWLRSEPYQIYQYGDRSKNDKEHCLKVDENIRIILTNGRTGSSPADYFILSVTAAYHDLDKANENTKLKFEHGHYSGKLVKKDPAQYGLVPVEVEAFSYISTFHNKGRFKKNRPPFSMYLPLFPYTPIKPEKLALIFFLADQMDQGYSRADDFFLKVKYTEGYIPEKALARNTIEGLTIHDDSRVIVVNLRDIPNLSPEENRRRFRAVEKAVNLSRSIMKPVEDRLCALGLPYRFDLSPVAKDNAPEATRLDKIGYYLDVLNRLVKK